MGSIATILAGCMMGNFVLPLKFARRWNWENVWFVFSLVSLLVIPWSLALWTVPDLSGVYASVEWTSIGRPVVFGALWGIAQVLFGTCAVRIGMALTYAIVIGLGAVLGSTLPYLAGFSSSGAGSGVALLTSLPVMLAGIVLCARAGRQRERTASVAAAATNPMNYGRVIFLAVVAGVFSCSLNLAFAFSQDIIKIAAAHGAKPVNAPFAVWALTLTGGAVVNLGYSVRLLVANGTWSRFRDLGDAPIGVIMGILWMGAISLYGVGATLLGADGPTLGWALFQISMVVMAGLSGFLSGEWRGASGGATRGMVAGLFLLTAAMILIARG